MKKVILLIVFFISMTALFAQTEKQDQPLKLGYVDSEVILAQLPEAIKAKSDLDALVQKWTKMADSMTTQLQTEYASYQKQAATMTPDKQKATQQSLVQQDQAIQTFKQQKFSQPNGEYFTKQDSLMAPVKAKVFKAIEEVAKAEGVNAQDDLTYKVLDRLKRGK